MGDGENGPMNMEIEVNSTPVSTLEVCPPPSSEPGGREKIIIGDQNQEKRDGKS